MSKVYIYVINSRVPSKTTKGKWDIYEEVHIKSRIIPKLYDSATFVLDVMNLKIEKNRHEHNVEQKNYTFDNVVSYLSKKHASVRNLMESYVDVMEAYNKSLEEAQAQANKEVKVEVQNEASET